MLKINVCKYKQGLPSNLSHRRKKLFFFNFVWKSKFLVVPCVCWKVQVVLRSIYLRKLFTWNYLAEIFRVPHKYTSVSRTVTVYRIVGSIFKYKCTYICWVEKFLVSSLPDGITSQMFHSNFYISELEHKSVYQTIVYTINIQSNLICCVI